MSSKSKSAAQLAAELKKHENAIRVHQDEQNQPQRGEPQLEGLVQLYLSGR